MAKHEIFDSIYQQNSNASVQYQYKSLYFITYFKISNDVRLCDG